MAERKDSTVAAEHAVPGPQTSLEQLRRSAAGDLFTAIASSICSAHELVGEAIADGEASPAVLVGLRALLQQAGMLAERAGNACGKPGVQDIDCWLLATRDVDALQLLEAAA